MKQTIFARYARILALALVFFVGLLIIVLARLNIQSVYNPHYLLLALNTVFISLVSFTGMFILARGFRLTGSWSILYLGGALLAWGMAAFLGGWLSEVATPNEALTAHNSAALLAAVLHLAAAFVIVKRIPPANELTARERRSTVLQIYIGILLVLIFIPFASVLGWLPPFFTENGSTPLRDLVLISAASGFVLSAIALLSAFQKSRTAFHYWYSLGQIMTALGLISVMIMPIAGAPLSWVGRIAQYLGGIYLFAAGWTAILEARHRKSSLGETLAAYFTPEKGFQALFETIPDGIITTDLNHSIIAWNQGAENLYGWKAEEVIGRKSPDVLPTVFAAGVTWEGMFKQLQEGGSWRGEVTRQRKDGSEIAVFLSASVIKNESGETVGLLGISHDVTERKQSEERQAYLASFPKMNPNPVIELTRDGDITYLNAAAERLLPGLKVGQYGLEHPFLSGLGPSLKTPSPEVTQSLVREVKVGNRWYQQSLSTIDNRVRLYALEVTERKQTEEELLKYREHLEEMVKERTKELQEEVVERKQAEAALRQSEEKFSKAFHSSPISMRILDLDNARVIDVNENFASLIGYPREEIIGRTSIELGILKKPEAMAERRRKLLEQGKIRDYEIEIITRTGEERICELSSDVIELSGRKVSLSALKDITEQRHAEATRLAEHRDRLLAYQRLAEIGKLSGSIAHEIRNPLATIDSSVVFLKMKLKDADEPLKRHLDRIKAAVDRSTTVIQALLEQARIREPLLITHDLRELTNEILASYRIPAGITVVREFPEVAVPVGVDKEQIRLAFENIIKNAVEVMDGKGTLTVSISACGNDANIVFRDTGLGIKPENLSKLFEPLFTTKADGVGFGLANAQMIIGKHGGTIEAKSEVGKGTSFIICLPLRGKMNK